MTVKKLIEELQICDPEAAVRFVYNYGDRGNSQVAAEVQSVEDGDVRYSEYFSDFVVGDENDDEDNIEYAVLLQG